MNEPSVIVGAQNTIPGSPSLNGETSAPEVLVRLLQQSERADASDIHLHMRQDAASVSFRLDGVMTPAADLPTELADRVFGRIKFLARLKTYQESLPQDGRIDKASVNARSDIRVATYPTVTGEKIVLRLFNAATVRTLSELDFPAEVRSELERFLCQTGGLLLLTGPAGSEKPRPFMLAYANWQNAADGISSRSKIPPSKLSPA